MKARAAWSLVLVVGALGAPFNALAKPPETTAVADPAVEDARARFQRGVQLFHEWSFEAALAEFRKAYQLAPSYRLLYNIAQVHYELHNYVDALKAFRQYLNEGGTDIAAERRAQVEAEVRKLEGRVGYIDVTANVEGAQVAIDEIPVGNLPMKSPILVNPGVRRVSVTKTGFGTTARNVTIAGGDHAQVQLELNEAVATRPQKDDAHKGATALPSKPERSRTAMWVSLGATGALGVGAGIFALLAQESKRDFEHQLTVYPTTKADVDRARSKLVRNAAITDGLAAGAVAAAGLTLVFALTGNSSSKEGSAPPAASRDAAPSPRLLGVAPTLDGVVAIGSF